MNIKVIRVLICGTISLLLVAFLQAQEYTVGDRVYVVEYLIDATPVKDQARSGTCWSFAALSFLESELLRTDKGALDLSEMYAVRNAYMAKAEKYVRMLGTINFGEGGEANDVTDAIERKGMVPESVFPGQDFDVDDFDFGGMDRELRAYVDRVIGSADMGIDPAWKQGFEAILDRYMGVVPSAFEWQRNAYTPVSFAESLGLHPEDYVLIGSYLHHPFYTGFVLEIPDNWSWEKVYNVPLDEMMEVLNRSLDLGFTVAWAADISEPGFSFEKGLAVLMNEDDALQEVSRNFTGSGSLMAESMADEGVKVHTSVSYAVTPEMRQEAFDRQDTQDDHAMHIIGKAHDLDGNPFYFIKNSWGDDNALEGYLLASEEYLRYKTISFFVNRNALDPELRNRLGIR